MSVVKNKIATGFRIERILALYILYVATGMDLLGGGGVPGIPVPGSPGQGGVLFVKLNMNIYLI